jgi:hypothetical protein
MTAHCLLGISKVKDVCGTVGTFLPGASTDEEDGDEGKQDQDNYCQFEQSHTGLGLHIQVIGQFHGVLFLVFYLVYLLFCRIGSAFGI